MSPDVKYDTFYTYDEMLAFLCSVQAEHAEWVDRQSLVTTPEGRNVWLVTLTDPATGPADEKPAYYVQAGLHAQEVAGPSAALHVIRTLLEQEAGRKLLQRIAFYVVPQVNPDGMEYAMTTRSAIRSRIEVLERRNGLVPKDMNGDGRILNMRWLDPAGSYREDDVDPRLLVSRQPGDAGPFYSMVTEGEIHDYDGTAIASATRNIDMNRNYAINWKPISVASKYPFSEPEVRAVGDFMLAHPNIFAGVDFHCGTNAILRLTVDSDAELNQNDLELTLRLGALAEKVTGLPLMSRDYGDAWRRRDILPGSSSHWAHFGLGISHYVIELGNGFNSAGISAQEYFKADARTRAVEFMRRVLACHDQHQSEIFAPWQPFDHPQLGKVDIGGVLQGNAYYMVAQCMKDVIPRTTDFVLQHAGYGPELVLTDIESVAFAPGIHRIRAAVVNIGSFSTNVIADGGQEDVRQPVRLQLLLPDAGEVLSRPPYFEFGSLAASGGKGHAEWFVQAPMGTRAKVQAAHPRGGTVRQNLTLE